jgi:hypothetical protein
MDGFHSVDLMCCLSDRSLFGPLDVGLRTVMRLYDSLSRETHDNDLTLSGTRCTRAP